MNTKRYLLKEGHGVVRYHKLYFPHGLSQIDSLVLFDPSTVDDKPVYQPQENGILWPDI